MKNSLHKRITSDAELLRVLPERLEAIFPGSKIEAREPRISERWQADAIVNIVANNRERRFVVEAKADPRPANILRLRDEAKKEGTAPLFATVHLSENLRRLCKDAGVSCFDLNGQAWISRPGLLIDRTWTSVLYRVGRSKIDPFSPKSQRLARLLLSRGESFWSQTALCQETGLSIGLVSRLLDHYEREGWAEGKRADWHLINRESLLDAWAAADAWERRTSVREYTFLDGDLNAVAERIARQAAESKFDLAYTQWFAGNTRHLYSTTPLLSAYCREFPAPPILASWGIHEVEDGGRLWLIIPRDEGVFRETRPVGPLTLVCDAQIYLDLLQVGQRGTTLAKQFRSWEGFCR